jgi:neutral amino acid transport system permease protein
LQELKRSDPIHKSLKVNYTPRSQNFPGSGLRGFFPMPVHSGVFILPQIISFFVVTCPTDHPAYLQLAQLTIDGLTIGSLIALAAVGLTLTYGILRLPNFAHGDLMTLGAYLSLWSCQLGIPVGLAIPVGTILTVGVCLVWEKLLWAPLRSQLNPSGATTTSLIIISIGLALFLRNGIQVLWGGSNQSYGLPLAQPVTVFCLNVVFYRLLIMLLTLVVLAGLYYLLQNTKMGKAMRAVADNLDLARVTGIDVERVILWTWVLAGSLTAMAGGLYGLITAIRPNMGWFLILPLFASVILGGIGSPSGAIVGALIIGVAQEVSTFWLPNAYKPAVALVVVMVVLWVRPQGLFQR